MAGTRGAPPKRAADLAMVFLPFPVSVQVGQVYARPWGVLALLAGTRIHHSLLREQHRVTVQG